MVSLFMEQLHPAYSARCAVAFPPFCHALKSFCKSGFAFRVYQCVLVIRCLLQLFYRCEFFVVWVGFFFHQCNLFLIDLDTQLIDGCREGLQVAGSNYIRLMY